MGIKKQKQNTKMKTYKLILGFFVGLLISCTNQNTYTLKNADSSKAYASAKAEVKYQDNQIFLQIDFLKNNKSYSEKRKFVKKDNSYYELYAIKHFDSNITDTMHLFSLSLKDTSYKQEMDYDKVNPIAPKGFYDWNVEISHQDGMHCLTKQHLVNISQKEQFYYDDKFTISKIVLFNSTDTLTLIK
jgi:hypothetical protein